MSNIPILNIAQFETEDRIFDVYSNDLQYHLEKNKHIIHKPHKHDFYLCVLFTEGSGIHEIDFTSYTISPGSVFFLKPGQTHSWQFDTAPKGYIFFHTQDFYDFHFCKKRITQFPFFSSYKNPPHVVLSKKILDTINIQFEMINTEYHQNSILKRQKLVGLIDMVYIDLTRLYMSLKPSKKVISSTYLNTITSLEKHIEMFYHTEKSAQFYADKLHISSKHLNRITKSTLGKTTTELITEHVILEAKRLIVHSENSLTNIALLLGYEDYAYFSRVFKLKTGITPIQFKKNYQ